MVHPRKSVAHKNIYFDTLVHDTGSLKLLVQNQTSHQIVAGLDDPYPLGEMESEPQSSYPGKILDLAVERESITEQEKDDIWEKNVLNWLYGEEKDNKTAIRNKMLQE